DREPVDDHLDRVLLLLRELRRLGEHVCLTVDADPAEPLLLELTEQIGVLPLAPPDDGCEHLEPKALIERDDAVDDLLWSLPCDRLSALRAVWTTGACVQQPQ